MHRLGRGKKVLPEEKKEGGRRIREEVRSRGPGGLEGGWLLEGDASIPQKEMNRSD